MRTLALLLSLAVLAPAAQAAEPLKKLAGKLQKGLRAESNKKVAVVGFPYADGRRSSGSSIVPERLTTFLVEGGEVEVIERGLLEKVLEELKLGTTGVLDEDSSRRLGKVLGVGAVVTGTLNDLPKGKTEVNARVIQTETGRILAAGQAKVERTWSDAPARPTTTPPPAAGGSFLGKPLAQIALLLDTSNSMDGLIAQAKTQLWKVVNQLANAERGGANPDVQVAIFEYGNSSLSADAGFLRQVLPFTSDLDKVSEALFALKTNGGEEYAGWAIRDATANLLWDGHGDVYRAIFIAGNEPFTQGPVDFRSAVPAAAARGIFVNTIFCGNRQEGVATQWKAGAELAGGDYTNIDQAARTAAIRAPQDDEIDRLGAAINDTFVPYGASGREAYSRQEVQDRNAAAFAAAGASAERAVFKAKGQYAANVAGDAVNEVVAGGKKASELNKEDLPAELQGMDAAALEAHLRKKAEERKAIQERIKALDAERRRYIAEKEREAAAKGESTLDQALIESVRGQAAKKEFSFK